MTSNSGIIITLQTECCASAWVFSHSKYVEESKHVCAPQAAPQVYLSVTMQLFLFSSMMQEQAVWSQSSGMFLISYVECKSCCSLSV